MGFPFRFPLRAVKVVAGAEEIFELRRRLKGVEALPLFKSIAGRGPQPSAERHTLPARLVHEPVSVFIGDYQLYPGHRLALFALLNVY